MLVGIRPRYYRGSSQQRSGPHCGPETLLTLGAKPVPPRPRASSSQNDHPRNQLQHFILYFRKRFRFYHLKTQLWHVQMTVSPSAKKGAALPGDCPPHAVLPAPQPFLGTAPEHPLRGTLAAPAVWGFLQQPWAPQPAWVLKGAALV